MAKKKAQPQLPAWVWLFTGVVTGLFAAFLVYLANVKGTPIESGPRTRGSSINGSVNASAPTSAGIPSGSKPASSSGNSSRTAATSSATANTDASSSEQEPLSPADRARKFEFYTLLPEAETLGAPDDDNKPAAKSSDTSKPADGNKTDDSKGDAAKQRTLLQTGSFQRAQDAEKLRAQIILLGLPASIQKVEVRPGETWHRVQAGPFSDAGSLTQAQKALTGAHIQHIVIRLKNS
mgnify:CR=1 FL=1